jgi:Uma2 family endonuclease
MSIIAKFSLDEYHRMIASGVFATPKRRRIELIEGELREMNPVGPDHTWLVNRLAKWSLRSAPERDVYVSVQGPLAMDVSESEPEPDIYWAVQKDYQPALPKAADVLLLIEVAHSSLLFDRSEKRDLYARAEIPDYWIVNVEEQTIEVHREPQRGSYCNVQTFSIGQEVHPLTASKLALKLDWLFESKD